MSIEQEEKWITGPELGEERRRLIQEGVPDDAPEFQDLWSRVDARDNYLYERYGKQYRDRYPDKWIAISLDGEVIIRNSLGQVAWAAGDAWGDGNFAVRKLAEFPGLELRH